jgi:outer membrane lipoprotein-sorting protein
MKYITLALLSSSILFAMNVEEIVQKSDNIRNMGTSMYERGHIVEYKNARKIDEMTIDIYAKEYKGGFKTLVRILSPKKDKNKLILRSGNKMWLFDPHSKATAQMSPQQRLMGQSSSSDVMSANFGKDYTLKLLGEERIKNGDKKMRTSYKVAMRAKSRSVSYPYVEYWVDKENYRPILAKFFSASKHLLKKSYYRKFKNVLGMMRPTQVLIIDGVDSRKATKLDFSNIQHKTINDSWFKKSYLPKFRGK